MEENQFDKDKSIDPGNLDLEWLYQSSIYDKYGKMYAKAIGNLARAEEKVKFVRSEIILGIKSGIYEDIKSLATGPIMEAYYRTHPDHIKAKEQSIEALEEKTLLEQALFSLNHKKASLEQLVKLMINNYFSCPSEPKDLSRDQKETIQDHRKEEEKNMNREKYRSSGRKRNA